MINQLFALPLLSMLLSLCLRGGETVVAVDSALPLEKLSEYRFFRQPLAALDPEDDVVPYDVNAPLFSNYAEKARFVRLPAGTVMNFNAREPFNFPPGTVLIKNFYFPFDMRSENAGRRIIETRLLVLDTDGWQAYPYIWNEEQSEAYYDPAGGRTQITYKDGRGKQVSTAYLIPNKNQCKSCHASGQALVPIGLTARQLNQPGANDHNQLVVWQSAGILRGLPDLDKVEMMPGYADVSAGLNLRARAYLDSNCGHCHRKEGPASTSGLFLDFHEQNPAHLGINKTPVAAGRGSGNLPYDISPGDPKRSILLFRMKTNDPGMAMPEVGREQIHQEGVQLIEDWIKSLPK